MFRMELPALYQFHRLQESIQQSPSWHSMENPKVIWGPSQAGYLDRVVPPTFRMQCHDRRKPLWEVPFEVRRVTRLHHLAHVPPWSPRSIDWMMRNTAADRPRGIQWTLWNQLEDLDFADHLALFRPAKNTQMRKLRGYLALQRKLA